MPVVAVVTSLGACPSTWSLQGQAVGRQARMSVAAWSLEAVRGDWKKRERENARLGD